MNSEDKIKEGREYRRMKALAEVKDDANSYNVRG